MEVHVHARVCPYCGYDFHSMKSKNNNEPSSSSGSGGGIPLIDLDAFSTIWGVLAAICLIVSFISIIFSDGVNVFNGIMAGLFVVFTIIHFIRE